MSEAKTLAELASEYKIHPSQICNWKQALLENAPNLFGKGKKKEADHEAEVAELLARTRQAGFDPQHLLPIVAGVASADYLVIRTDGVDTGKVFIWYHEEQTCLTDLEVQVGDLFPWLEARAKAGNTLVM